MKIDTGKDSVTVIRTYPSSIIEIIPGKDSTYTLLSGDKIYVVWRTPTLAKAFCEIVPDTVTIPK